MKTPKVSIVIPVYKPDEKVFEILKKRLKEQTIKAEVIENWNMPEAISMNTGIKKAKGEIVVILPQDAVPKSKYWLERLIKPLSDKKVIAVVSDLYLPEEHWRNYSFLIKILTLNERKKQFPKMDARGCAYRKKELVAAGMFDEDPKVIGIDTELYVKLKQKGKIVRSNEIVFHMHRYDSAKKIIKNLYTYSEGNGKAIRKYGRKAGAFFKRISRAIPVWGVASIIYRFPWKRYFYLFPIYAVVAIPFIHIVNILGFWKGFFFPDKESDRNKVD